MTLELESGGVPSEVSHPKRLHSNKGKASRNESELEKQRILLISNLESTEINTRKYSERKKHNTCKPKRTKNRKEVSISNMINRNGIEYKINNASTYGIYPKILNKALDQLDICITKWNRVFVIRFDLHQKFHSADNKMISKFRKNLARRIERKYEIFEVGYTWVREHEKAKSQHYHMAMFLDGDKINHSARISEIIREAWEALKTGNSVHIPQNCYYNVVDAVSKADVVYRISYLAKQRGKGYRSPQTKDYGTSQLITPKRYTLEVMKNIPLT